MTKEPFYDFRQFPQSARGADSSAYHFVHGFRNLLADACFHIAPDLFIRIQLWRIRRLEEQLELSHLGLDEVFNQLGLVDGVPIDQQVDWFGRPHHQTLHPPPRNRIGDLGFLTAPSKCRQPFETVRILTPCAFATDSTVCPFRTALTANCRILFND